MTKEEKKQRFCGTCRDNFYNRPGNSHTGECWHLEGSQIVERIAVGTWQEPPYADRPQSTLDCHHWERGTSWIARDDCRVIRE